MSPKPLKISQTDNQQGFGLIAALFMIVILAMFGSLAARYLATTTITSTDDYLWAKSLYAAESAANRRILYHDGGGTGGFVTPVVNNMTTVISIDNFQPPGSPSSLEVSGFFDTNGNATPDSGEVVRTITIKYML
ncbi:MAG: hypothetical protein KJ950_12115 [Proteobacteria bacterium]|nr:hypothetical protein [Pseudomonadota bacterium]MBU1688077.1 hypothetical protein [Pseudomonadota bacterium]